MHFIYEIWHFSILHDDALCGIHRSRDSWRRIWQMEVHTFLAGCQRGKALVSYSILHFTRSHNLCMIPPGWTRHIKESTPILLLFVIRLMSLELKEQSRKHYLCLNSPFFTHSQITWPKFKKINNDSKIDSVFDQCKHFFNFIRIILQRLFVVFVPLMALSYMYSIF